MRLFPFNVNRIISFIMNFLKSDTGFTLTVEFIIIDILRIGTRSDTVRSYSMKHTDENIQRSLES